MAAVASRNNTNSPLPHARMSSPKDTKRVNIVKTDDSRKEANAQHINDEARTNASSRLGKDSAQPVQPAETSAAPSEGKTSTTAATNGATNSKASTNNANNNTKKSQPLGPPPRPNNSEPDYFNQTHNQPINAYHSEPNPFESQFGNPASETPGKTLLPPVASLTSPSSLMPAGTPGWGSLRSGPLSPAMLAGPTGNNDYFGDAPFSRGFPTPNESSLRTGLTPGGGGSMFPAPSPNTQALYNSLQPSGGATPGTLDFLRTMNRASQANPVSSFGGPTSQPTESNAANSTMDTRSQQQQPTASDPFAHPDADAVNGLYMLAQANGLRSQYQQPQAAPAVQTNVARATGTHSQDTSPLTKSANRGSIGTISRASNESEEDVKPPTKAAAKNSKKGANANGRRKAEDTPAKAPANKRAKNNASKVIEPEPEPEDDDDVDDEDMMDGDGPDTRKMTDEEKRKNFLERNRVAALKCRQRKKQWLSNLQTKVELFSSENDALSQTVTQLREEIVNLKTLLLAHKECPVSAAQGLSSAPMHAYLNETGGPAGHHTNPYGMQPGPQGNGMPPGMAPMMGPGQMAGQLRGR